MKCTLKYHVIACETFPAVDNHLSDSHQKIRRLGRNCFALSTVVSMLSDCDLLECINYVILTFASMHAIFVLKYFVT